jgi:hypothetical protein
MKVRGLLLCLALISAEAAGETLNCNLQGYKSVEGLKTEANGSAATLTWSGESGQQLRAQFTIRDGQPIVQELAARAAGGQWVVLGKDLLPDFQVTTGRRRISHTQLEMIKQQGVDTPEQENIRKWNTFWDAPLEATPRTCHVKRTKSVADRLATSRMPVLWSAMERAKASPSMD